MTTIPELKAQYEELDRQLPAKEEETIDRDCLLTFEYEYPERDTEVIIDTDEFTAVCPWTALPDTGELVISYIPSRSCIGAEVSKVLPAVLPRCGHRAGTRRQPHPQRPGGLLQSPPHEKSR